MKHLALVFVAAVALYLPTARYGFVQDDRAIIVSNPAAHSVSAALRAFDDSYWPRETGAGLYRPLTILSYAVEWSLGARAGWMHVTNAVLHALACVLVMLVVGRWLPALGAVAAGLVFAAHPVHVEGVASLVARAELLAAIGILAAVLAARGRHWLVALAFCVAAMLSKEHGVVVGVVLLIDDWLAPRGAHRYPKAFYGAVALVTVAFVGVWSVVGRVEPGHEAAVLIGTSFMQRIAVALPALLQAGRLLLWPDDLSIEYGPQVLPYYGDLSLAAAGGLAVGLTVVWIAWRARHEAPELTFAAALAAVTYLPTSNLLFSSGVVLAERALYLPVILVATMVGVLAVWLAAWRGSAFATTIMVLVVVSLGARSLLRLPTWRDNRTLLLTTLAEHPESYRAHASAAAVLAGTGDTAAARREYAQADSLYADDPIVGAGRAMLLLSLGDRAGAAPLVARARARLPHAAMVLRGAFLLAVARGDTSAARALADTALRLRPGERSWYVEDSQSVVRVLRPAG